MAKRPAFQFYPGDWLRSTDVRTCSVGARGLWIDMICLMHEGTPYGHLKVARKVILPENLAKIVGATLHEVEGWLLELEEVGVFSRSDDGTIFSRRMIRDEEIREKRASGGHLGGNPKLKSEKATQSKVNLPATIGITPASASASASLNSYTHGAPAVPPVEPCPSGPSEAFKLFKSIYPRWRGEAEAWRAFQAEMWRLYETQGLNDAQAEQVIIEGAKRFRDSPSGQKPDSPHDPDFRLWPANWLKGGHHADSEEELQKPNRKSDHVRNNTRRNTGAKAIPTVGNGDSDLDSLIDRVIQGKPAESPPPAAAGVRQDG